MSKNKKRTLADIGANAFPSAKRARTQHAAPLPPAPESASLFASSPTLIASTLISTRSPNISATDSVTNAPTTISASSEPSSSANNTSGSDTPPVQNKFIPTYHIPTSVSTSSTATTSSSPTSTSASITDSISCSTCSLSDSQDPSSPSITDSDSTSSFSGTDSSLSTSDSDSTSPARTLTAKNLATLQQRLNALLPRLQSANELLEKERQQGTLAERDIENVHDEVAGGYIAMELGLGVLEQRLKRGAGAVGVGSGGGGGGSESGDSIEGWDMVMDKGMAIGKVMRRRGVGGSGRLGLRGCEGVHGGFLGEDARCSYVG